MGQTSEPLFLLKPVIFRYKEEIDPAGISSLDSSRRRGQSESRLVVRDKEGKPYSVRYEQVNAMLLNEFIKEHKRVDAQQSKIDQQQATISALKSTLARQRKDFDAVVSELRDVFRPRLRNRNSKSELLPRVSREWRPGSRRAGLRHR